MVQDFSLCPSSAERHVGLDCILRLSKIKWTDLFTNQILNLDIWYITIPSNMLDWVYIYKYGSYYIDGGDEGTPTLVV